MRGTDLHVLEDRTCKGTLRTGDHVWPPRIWLTPPNRTANIPSEYSYDRDAVRRFAAELKQAELAHRNLKITATFVGKIDARESYSGKMVGEWRWIGNGFGHLNECAAQLVYMTVTDWQIIPVEPDNAPEKQPQTGP